LPGPPVGGFLTTFLSWHWIFLINIPIGLAGIVFAIKILPDDGIRVRDKVDWTGFCWRAPQPPGIVFGLSVISLPALPPVWGLAATGIGGVVADCLSEARACASAKPLLDPKMFPEPDIFPVPARVKPVPGRVGRRSVSIAADASARLRHVAVPVGHDDLHIRRPAPS
jgi:hypothetical protein